MGLQSELIRAGGLTCSEISYVAQYVQDGDQAKTEWSRSFDSPNWVFDFAHHVKSVLIPLVREGDVDERICQVEAICSGASEWVSEVRLGIGNTRPPTQYNESGDRYAASQTLKHWG